MNTQISSLIEDQLPGFIVAQYENFQKVLEAYYEHQESPGNPLDIITNLTTYQDIDYYEKYLLQERTSVSSYVNSSDTTIIVEDASSFPIRNGYIKIGNEICFYKERTDTEFLEVSRGVSGTTQLGDLYSSSKFISTNSDTHQAGENVDNLSNLFLYGIVKSFEKQYLQSFPQDYLKDNVDKRTLIKNISKFYKVKGTDKSIRFIFNTIVSKSADDVPTTYYPKNQTLKASTSDWDSVIAIQAEILSGDVNWLTGQTIVQRGDNNIALDYASASIESFYSVDSDDGRQLFNLIVSPTSVNSDFVVPHKTVLSRDLLPAATRGDTITVDSTFGWKGRTGVLSLNGEVIKYEGKNARQFVIKERGSITRTHGVGDLVTSYSTAKAVTPQGEVTLLIYGVLTNLAVEAATPYTRTNDKVNISKPGFETVDPILYDQSSRNYRWKINTTGSAPSIPLNPTLAQSIQSVLADVGAIYQDDDLYYITTSSYPSTQILSGSTSETLSDPNLLKFIPKVPTTTPEIYKTPNRDIGIFVDGTIAFGYKSDNLIKYGPITGFNITSRGSGYAKPPFVLINGQPDKARTVLSGDTVTDIVSITDENFTAPPTVEIISGRNAVLSAVVTSGEITSIKVVNPGEYYSSPPLIQISDRVGRGRFAEYRAELSSTGQIVELVKIAGGKFYTQENVIVNVIPDANSNKATATSNIKEWVANRYLESTLDDNGGTVFTTLDDATNFYGVISNPRRLRLRLGDNLITSNLTETAGPKSHSPIIGYAYDGNPIYGPYGYEDPLNIGSSVVRMESGYSLKANRVNGPTDAPYPMGTFIDDYEWTPTINTGKTRLDVNNGRFCVTPEYPNGVYAYFLTIDVTGTPVYPYIIGDNFYSLPVKSNYESDVIQAAIPGNARRLFISGTDKNGQSEIAIIDSVTKGSVSSVIVEDSLPNFSVGSRIYVEDKGTGGSGATGVVSSTFGKRVTSLESRETKASVLTSVQPFYSFEGDIVTQPSTGASGELIRDIREELTFALRAITGDFEVGSPIESSSTVLGLLIDKNCTYTEGATLELVFFDDPTNVIASGTILVGTVESNSVRIKVNSGNFSDYLNYDDGETILKSSDLANTAGAKIVVINNLSAGVDISDVNSNVAIAETDGKHDFAEGDVVDIQVDPDENTTETTYYVSKKKYQELDLIPVSYSGKINDTGIGESTMIGLGRDYVSGVYNDVELIFSNFTNTRDGIGSAGDTNNAKATVTVSDDNFDGSGQVTSIVVTDGGSEYNTDDILTINGIDKIDPTTLNTSIDPTMTLLNGEIIDQYTITFFKVDQADYPTVEAAMPNIGEVFVDSEGYEYVYVASDPANYRFQYFNNTPYDLTTAATVFGVTITEIVEETAVGAPKPQFRFNVAGQVNPDYEIRVGSTWTMDAIPSHPVYIVNDGYVTGLKDDGVALKMETYTEADGVTNNGVLIGVGDPAQSISFTPIAPGTYYYVCISHPEAVGKITVYPAPSTAIPLLSVNAVGLGVQRTEIKLQNVFSLATDDLLQVGSEIMKITGVDKDNRKISLQRGVEGTLAVNHLASSSVKSYKPRYRFTPGTQIFGGDVNDPYVVSYDPETHRLVVNYDYNAVNPRELTTVSAFTDHSAQPKVVSVSRVYGESDRLLFSLDQTSFETNPVVDIQKYYFYKFDTSHPSMLGSYLDVSTSANYNVFTEEKEAGLAEPGNAGAFVRIRLGYGANIGDLKRKEVNFTTYYYFLTSSDTDTGGSYLRVVDDPLAGIKPVVFTTDTKFTYALDDVPQYDGSGNIRYTGRSVGKIASISLSNLGENYETLPIIKGVTPAPTYRAEVEAIRDASTNTITSIEINYPGKEYSKPKAVIASSSSGEGLEMEVQSDAGIITAIRIVNPGKGYTTTPLIDIIETDNKLFFESEDIGIPKSVKFVNYGTFYHNDDSIKSEYTSPAVFVLSNFELDSFSDGERIEQRINGITTATARVAPGGWKEGSNILRLSDINGVFDPRYQIFGASKGRTATIRSVFSSKFNPTINTRLKTIGKYTSDRGMLSSINQRVTDSLFYQDYSYVVRSRTPISEWRNAVKDTTHPAGFKVFGELYLESEASAEMQPKQQVAQHLTSYIILPKGAVTSLSTKRSITTSVVKVEDTRVVRGRGSAAVDSFDETLTRVREIELSPAFDGRYDPDTGLKIGNRTFTLKDKKTGTAFTPHNAQSIMVMLDGVAQNPGYSYKLNGNQITFYEAPLGKRLENVDGKIVDVPSQTYYIRGFEFRDAADNNKYIRKLKDIKDNFDGRTRIFDLFYEDGSIVKTDKNENLLIYLNAVLQQGSYEIRRFNSATKTDRIVFSKAPKNWEDLYQGVPDQLQNEEYFFGYSVGSYERLGVNEKLIPYNGSTNMYQILDDNQGVKNFDTPLYAYVFVDGVLQRDGISYKINGPTITFNQPLGYAKQNDGSFTTSRVDILYFYGKDYAPSITMFDFEDDTFFNRTEVTLTGNRDAFDSWYKQNTTYKTVAYQIVNGLQRVWGEVVDVGPSTGNDWALYLRSQNINAVEGEPVYFTRRTPAGGTDTINISFSAYSFQYLTSSVTNERIINRTESNYSPFLFNADLTDNVDYRGFVTREHPNLRVGDKIQIDGETEYRDVYSIPLFAKPKDYRSGGQVSNSYFARINTSTYDKPFFGEGLSVTANVEDGVVTSLNWNKRDLERYFNTNILLNPTAYQYYTPPVLNFVPVNNVGGGAKAEVVVYGGQIIDLILIDGGSGYSTAPRVVVARGYNILRSNNYAESSFLVQRTAEPVTVLGPKMTVISSVVPDWLRNKIEHIATFVTPIPIDFKEILVCVVTPDPVVVTPAGTEYQRTGILELEGENNNLSHAETLIERDYEQDLDFAYTSYSHPVTKYYQTGVLNMHVMPMGSTAHHFTHGLAGPSVSDFVESLFIDTGYSSVSGFTVEQLGFYFNGEFETIAEWQAESQITDSNITSTGRELNFVLPSIQELGAYLDSSILSTTVNELSVEDTTNFPSSGKLLIGKEIISYSSKLADRFQNLSRGLDGTTATAHNAGTILRTIGTATTS